MEEQYNAEFFDRWASQLKEKIYSEESLYVPQLDEEAHDGFIAGCQGWWDAHSALQDANREVKRLKKVGYTEEEGEAAMAVVHAAEAALPIAQQECVDKSMPVLQAFDSKYNAAKVETPNTILEFEIALCQCAAISQATSAKLGAYCSVSKENANRVMKLLTEDIALLKHILVNGHGGASPIFYDGRRQGMYGEAMEVYEKILSACPKAAIEENNSDLNMERHIYNRLAIACACEFASPLQLFDRPGVYVHPVARYKNYERAYDEGKLDPHFRTFTTWQLRMVINADVPDEELDWGRSMLMNYRPDFTVLDNPQWTYSMIVKSDVQYRRPDFRPNEPRDMMQHISTGGKCGPRARFGRFILKAFGIPQWGCKLPGHAYLMRWSATEPVHSWKTNLGAGDPKWAYWDFKRGEDFVLEAVIREKYRVHQDVYGTRVSLLEWLAAMNNETYLNYGRLRAVFCAHPNYFYYSLGICQRLRLSVTQMGDEDPPRAAHIYPITDRQLPENKLLAYKNRSVREEKIIYLNGLIIVPAAAYEQDQSNRVSAMKSYLGGQQLLIENNSRASYRIYLPPIAGTPQEDGVQYSLSCKICTVHIEQEQTSFTLTVSAADGSTEAQSYIVNVPYTIGEWKETAPINIKLFENKETVLKLERPHGTKRVAMKEIKLVPMGISMQ